ncbi:MAG: hypothetical protein AAGD28_29450 [Bacteroidota bacterium]
MTISTLRITCFLCLATFLISCNSSTSKSTHEKQIPSENSQSQIDKVNTEARTSTQSKAEDQDGLDSSLSGFVENLKSGKDLSSFFNPNWSFVYHEDNRCEGSTDGQVENLSNTAIDSEIKLAVKNDGDGWACEKKEPTSYELDFDLKQKVADWDRVEIADYGDQEEKIMYVLGKGESDFLKLHFNDQDLIIIFEYRSEDPG